MYFDMIKKIVSTIIWCLLLVSMVSAIKVPNMVGWDTATTFDPTTNYLILQSWEVQSKITADNFANSISGNFITTETDPIAISAINTNSWDWNYFINNSWDYVLQTEINVGDNNYFTQFSSTWLKQSIYYTTGTSSINFSDGSSMAAWNYMSLFWGQGNTMWTNNSYATIVWWSANVIGVSSTHASIIWWWLNNIGNFSTFSSIIWWYNNEIWAFGWYSSIIWWFNNTIAATYSVAMWKNATIGHTDSFVFNNSWFFSTTKAWTFNVNTYWGTYIYWWLQIGWSNTLSQIKLLSWALLASPWTWAIEYNWSKLYMTMWADVRQEFNTVSFAQLFWDYDASPAVFTITTAWTFYWLTGAQSWISWWYLSYSTGDGTVTILTGWDGYYVVNISLSFGWTSNSTVHCWVGTGADNVLPQTKFQRKLGTDWDVWSASSAWIIFARIWEVYQMFCTADGSWDSIDVKHWWMTFNKIGR